MHAVLAHLAESIERRPRRVRLIYYPAVNYRADTVTSERFRLLPDASFGGVAIFEST
jgi:hypothetical protein